MSESEKISKHKLQAGVLQPTLQLHFLKSTIIPELTDLRCIII